MKPRQKSRTPTVTNDSDGELIVMVPLANHSKPAKVLKEDYDALMRLGISSQWTFNMGSPPYRYVRCGADTKGRLFTIARLVSEAGSGRIVKYRDGDRLNLRRDNLYLKVGKAKARERSAIESATTSTSAVGC